MTNKIETLRKKIGKLDSDTRSIIQKKTELEIKLAKEYFKGMTMEDLEKLWNENGASWRYKILEHCPYYARHLDKLDSHGGLHSGEIEQQIIDAKFGRCEWLDTEAIGNLFGDFLKDRLD